MSKLREAWKKMSLKKKIIVMTMYAIVMTACVLFFSTIVLYSVLADYEENMSQNSKGYELQEAIRDETDKFLTYTRERSEQSKREMHEACQRTEELIEQLPFDYEQIG